MKLGIIGLPQCGKTTLFSALTHDYNPTGQKVVDGRAQIDTAIVSVPDERIDWLSTHYQPKKDIPCKDYLSRYIRHNNR